MKRIASILIVSAGLAACGDDATGSGGGGGSGGSGDGGSSTSATGTTATGTSTSGTSGTSSGTAGTSSGTSGTSSGTSGTSGGTSSSADAASSSGDASASVAVSSGSTGGGVDAFAAERTACINRINELRATKGAYAYAQWGDGEACADGQAASDEQSGTPHGAFGSCGESSQNECLGHGPSGIVQCLDQMWAEKDQPDCAGCDACALGDQGACNNCDFYGQQNGQVCGHYVNMRSLAFAEAACGFNANGSWDVINFR